MYIERMCQQRQPLTRAIGRSDRLRQAATELRQWFLKGVSEANALFPIGAG